MFNNTANGKDTMVQKMDRLKNNVILIVVLGDSMERYPERCFHIIVPGQPKFDFNTSSISPLYETSYKNMILYIKQIKIMSVPQ